MTYSISQAICCTSSQNHREPVVMHRRIWYNWMIIVCRTS